MVGATIYDSDRELILSRINALAGIPHPENLPALLEACRYAASYIDLDAPGDAYERVDAAYAALYGE